MAGPSPQQRAMPRSAAARQAAPRLRWRATRVPQQQASQHSWQPSPRSRLRCYQRRAHALPSHAHHEPARMLSLDGRCVALAESHTRLSDRLVSRAYAAVARHTRSHLPPDRITLTAGKPSKLSSVPSSVLSSACCACWSVGTRSLQLELGCWSVRLGCTTS